MDRDLGGSKIFIGLNAGKGEMCGILPEQTESGKWYTVKCKQHIKGKMVVIAGSKNK